MLRISSRAVRSTLFLFALCVMTANIARAQDNCTNPPAYPDFPGNMKQKKVANVTIPGTTQIKGYIENLPNDYSTNPTKKYPVLIFIHGINETGDGSVASLCRLVSSPWWWTPSVLPEFTGGPGFPTSVTDQNGQTFKFIVISAQLTDFGGSASNTINKLIDYLIGRYRVDASRVYLTGLSAGANFIQSYVTASEANARRIAAITPVAPCDLLSSTGAANVARAGLPYWTFQCINDNMCNGTNAQNNANLINSQSPTIPAKNTTFPVPEQACNPFAHDVWGYAYNQNFRQMVNGRNVNSYEWMVQYSRSSLLPVALENYTVTLRDGKVIVRWTTSAESNNARFNVERSTDGQKFIEIATIPAIGNNNGKTYEWVDERPLLNLSYYRLTQTDLNGRQEWFQIKKVLNRATFDRSIIIAPNPFTTELTAFVNVPQTQHVTITITDLSGRILKTANGKYAQGAAEINIKTTDLPKGSYFLKVQGENFAQTQKIVKQ
jgi:predicted esterase